MVAINKPKRIRNRIPHSIQGSTTTTQLSEPFRERDIIQLPNHIHSSIEVEQSSYNR